MDRQSLDALVEEITKTQQKKPITPRQLFEAFGFRRRSTKNNAVVKQYLEEHNIVAVPFYTDVWVDNTINLVPKPLAMRRGDEAPVKQLQILEAATHMPLYVSPGDNLSKAVTIMQMHKYSQLPVINNLRNISGSITWESIGTAIANGVKGEKVNDYMQKAVTILSLETPLLDAIDKILANDFAFVVNTTKELCGIVTTADISEQYIRWTKPFVLLEQIENHLRMLMEGKFLLEDIQKNCQDDRLVKNIDDLTFGEYLRLIENPIYWDKLGLGTVDRTYFIKQLNKVREARNDVMHFEPAGLDPEQMSDIQQMADYLKNLLEYVERGNQENK